MVKIRDAERAQFPRLAAWLPPTLARCPDEPDLWQRFLDGSGVSAPIARDALGGKIMSPTLQVAGLRGETAAAFDAQAPGLVSLDRRVAARFETTPDSQPLQELAKMAVLGQVVSWCRFRNGQQDFAQRGADFAAALLGRPLRAAFTQIFGDSRVAIRLTAQDAEDLIKLTIAEAGGAGSRQGRAGQAGVIFVVLNRVASTRFKNSIRGVIDEPKQFEPVLGAPGKSVTGLRAPTAADRAAIAPILDDIVEDRLVDPTHGATFFQNVQITQARNTEFAKGVPPVAVIADHSFYDRFKANDPVTVPPWRLVRA